jgi:putative OPT family oligopeptide transporter
MSKGDQVLDNSSQSSTESRGPYIPANQKLPETTVRAIILGIVLSAVLAGANAYLGLFAGLTVSASIPAAVISMMLLKVLGRGNILENNAVQTAASAGESLAAGVIFTIPALVLMGRWEEFNYLQTAMIALSGGVLGVLFTIPLRSALIVKQQLQFPEGVATSEVLKSGEEGGKSVVYLVWASLIGAGVKLTEKALELWPSALKESAFVGSGKSIAFFGINLSPALVAVGYIVGLRISMLVFIGGVITWWFAMPIYASTADGAAFIGSLGSELSTTDIAETIWSKKLRYLGVGAMVVGGIWALISIRSALNSALSEGLKAFQSGGQQVNKLRTEIDTPMSWVLIGVGVLVVPIFFIYLQEIQQVGITLFMTLLMVFIGFLFSAVAGYMAGLVGSSNNPISGVTIATILFASLILLVLIGTGDGDTQRGAAAAVLIGAVVCCAAAIAGDNMQDLKAGHILGATPKRLQIMQMVGVVAAALTLPFTLNLLHEAYGIGGKDLPAPQASLMQSVAEGVFSRNLPWDLISVGAVIGVLIIITDEIQRRRGSSFRVPVLAVGVGLYLPFELDSAIMLGGIIAWMVARSQRRKGESEPIWKSARSVADRAGLLFASGLITGEALMGIFLAIPIAVTGNKAYYPLQDQFHFNGYLGLTVLLLVCFGLYQLTRSAYLKKIRE